MDKIISLALESAKKSAALGEIPIAAIIFDPQTKKIISKAHNQIEKHQDPTAHAEMIAIKEACMQIKSKYLQDLALFVTLEPCAMCMQAICFAQIKYLYFGAYDFKKGAISTHSGIVASRMNNHLPEIFGGFKEQECSSIITQFFLKIRNS
jgi:tRNA(adenine34) deaminase